MNFFKEPHEKLGCTTQLDSVLLSLILLLCATPLLSNPFFYPFFLLRVLNRRLASIKMEADRCLKDSSLKPSFCLSSIENGHVYCVLLEPCLLL